MSEPLDYEALVDDVLHHANDQESHVERDASTFHPSQLVQCERRAYCSKLGLDDQSDILGVFQTGTLIHEFLEDRLGDAVPNSNRIALEELVEYADPRTSIKITGRADCIDVERGEVHDFKTRNGWYNFDPPVQRHLDQLHLYMAGLPHVDEARVIYLSKGDMEVRQWPEDGTFEFNPDRYEELIAKAERICAEIEANGMPETVDDIPFEKCGCYFCEQETLVDDLEVDDAE